MVWRRSWVIVVGLSAALPFAGCSSSGSEDSLPGAYEACDEGLCATGACSYEGALGTVCLPDCSADTDCPSLPDGSSGICLDGSCRPTSCEGWAPSGDVACVDGVLRHCSDIESPSCVECDICGEDEYCSTDAVCVPRKQPGQACEGAALCVEESRCIELKFGDLPALYDGKEFCELPTGVPCWLGDPCQCDKGTCTYACESDADCSSGSECIVDSGSAGYQSSCRRKCDPEEAGACGANAKCEDIALATSLYPVYVCTADGPRPARSEGWPCKEDAECDRGTCCAPGSGDVWGSCAGDGGC